MQRKAFENELSKVLILVACHPTRWWDWCMPEDEKTEYKQFLLTKLRSSKNGFIKCWQYIFVWRYQNSLEQKIMHQKF